MRSLEINKRPLYGLNYVSSTPVLDQDGYETGEHKITYSKAFRIYANISGAKGTADVETFGVNLDYDKVMVMSVKLFKKLGLTDNSVFFIDKAPEYEANGYPKYDYRVKKIADTLNEVSIALERVRNNG